MFLLTLRSFHLFLFLFIFYCFLFLWLCLLYATKSNLTERLRVMGVPRLFRLLAERYPLILRDCNVGSPEFDHLYLDFNGRRLMRSPTKSEQRSCARRKGREEEGRGDGRGDGRKDGMMGERVCLRGTRKEKGEEEGDVMITDLYFFLFFLLQASCTPARTTMKRRLSRRSAR